MIAQRLRDLDNRVLRLDKQEARLRTEEGWRKSMSRWRLFAVLAALALAAGTLFGLYDQAFGGFIGVGGGLAFQAGMRKAEEDRLHHRGMYRYLPPGL